MLEYMQTSEGQIVSGIIIAAIIFSAFVLFSIKGDRKRKPTKEDLWTAQGYYNYLLAVMKASNTMLELEVAWEMVENTWFQKTFRFPVHIFTRRKLYLKLVDAYAKNEIELTKVKVELCKN